MGLHTDYLGRLRIQPLLSPAEVDFLKGFHRTRHCGDRTGLDVVTHPTDNDPADDVASSNRVAVGLTFDHVLSGMFVEERRETAELFALAVKDNVVRRRTLVPRLAGVDEWGYRGEDEEQADRTTYLAARRERFAAAIADDLRRAG